VIAAPAINSVGERMSTILHDPAPDLPGSTHIMIATTCYDRPSAEYTFSLAKTRQHLTAHNVRNDYYMLHGNCHVDDARNQVVADFLHTTDCEYLLFIDADVVWEPKQIRDLLGHNKPLIGGVYPYRDDGHRTEAPVRMLEGTSPIGSLLEVEGLPTGFMLIKRHVLERLERSAQTYIKGDSSVPIIFERTFDGEIRWGGDLAFCRKWREAGGEVWADLNMRLGHVGEMTRRDSLGSILRRRNRMTLAWVCHHIRTNDLPMMDWLTEAVQHADNPWGVGQEGLSVLIRAVKELPQGANILEAGSGLTTVLMAAARPDVMVWAMEHSPLHAEKTRDMATLGGVANNIVLIKSGLKNEFYDITEDDMKGMPGYFDMAFVDGPPRDIGQRNKFFDLFGGMVGKVVCDDADDPGYRGSVSTWADDMGWETSRIGDRTIVIEPPQLKEATA
jgi:hypothetical protein